MNAVPRRRQTQLSCARTMKAHPGDSRRSFGRLHRENHSSVGLLWLGSPSWGVSLRFRLDALRLTLSSRFSRNIDSPAALGRQAVPLRLDAKPGKKDLRSG